MHALLHLLIFWALAFASLFLALVLLNIYSQVIDSDLTLRNVRQESVIAGFASLIEAVSFWLVVTYAPGASRALIIPALIVAFLYKVAHLEDWSRSDIFLLLSFQVVIAGCGGMLYFRHIQPAIMILAIFAGFLVIYGYIVKSLGD